MEKTEQKSKYLSPKEVSNDIYRVVELAENLKSLHFNKATSDPAVISKYEQELADRKMDIIEYLREPIRYDMFRSSPEGRHALFFKKVQQGLFENEIGLDLALREKIYRDFAPALEKIPEDQLLTPQEKRNLQMLSAMDSEQQEYFKEISQFINHIYNKSKIFSINWNYMMENLPEFLDASGKRVIGLVKANPHFLKDHPNHFLKNKGSYYNVAPTSLELNEAIQGASIGYAEFKEKLSRYEKIFSDFDQKVPEQEAIAQVRENALKTGLDNKSKYKI